MPPRDLDVRLRHAEGMQAPVEVTHRWPLRTLVAFLFDGRQCDQVRALLARGEADAHGRSASWSPVALTAEELTAIEREFPEAQPDRQIVAEQVARAELVVPAGAPTVTVPLRTHHPVVREATARARYLRFDYGPWADVYETPLTRTETMELLADVMLGVPEGNAAERAVALVEESPAALWLIASRQGVAPPWGPLE